MVDTIEQISVNICSTSDFLFSNCIAGFFIPSAYSLQAGQGLLYSDRFSFFRLLDEAV